MSQPPFKVIIWVKYPPETNEILLTFVYDRGDKK